MKTFYDEVELIGNTIGTVKKKSGSYKVAQTSVFDEDQDVQSSSDSNNSRVTKNERMLAREKNNTFGYFEDKNKIRQVKLTETDQAININQFQSEDNAKKQHWETRGTLSDWFNTFCDEYRPHLVKIHTKKSELEIEQALLKRWAILTID